MDTFHRLNNVKLCSVIVSLLAAIVFTGILAVAQEGPVFESYDREKDRETYNETEKPTIGSDIPSPDYMKVPGFVEPISIKEGKYKMDMAYKRFKESENWEDREYHLKLYQAYQTWLGEKRRHR